MTLVPEKRVDKNGVLTTKHVRATSRTRKEGLSVPAPSLVSAAPSTHSKGTQKAYKPRPSQTTQKQRRFDSNYAKCHENLKSSEEYGETWGRSIDFLFTASEAEMYSVLSVASAGDALRLLDHGFRTADDAVKYMRRKGAKDAIIDLRELAEGAFQRGISSENFMLRIDTMLKDDSPYILDTLELASIASISDQSYGTIQNKVLGGKIKLDDIKYLGPSKLKSYDRLRSTEPALTRLNEPDPKFTIDDLKTLVERANVEGSKNREFRIAVDHLIEDGAEAINDAESLDFFYRVTLSHRFPRADRFERIAYETKFFKTYQRKAGFPAGTELAMRLRDAGVPADEAARLMNEGMSERAVIGVVMQGTEKPLAEGWL